MSEDVNDLLNRHPAAVYLWLEDWLKRGNRISPDSEINWLGFGECAAAFACNQYERRSVLECILWGSIAVTIREHLAKSESGGLGAAMWVRYNLLVQFGDHPSDPLCDSKIIRDWFFRVLPMSLEQASLESQSWHAGERTFELKWTVEWLESLRFLVAAGKLEMDPDLQLWLDLLNRLRPQTNVPPV